MKTIVIPLAVSGALGGPDPELEAALKQAPRIVTAILPQSTKKHVVPRGANAAILAVKTRITAIAEALKQIDAERFSPGIKRVLEVADAIPSDFVKCNRLDFQKLESLLNGVPRQLAQISLPGKDDERTAVSVAVENATDAVEKLAKLVKPFEPSVRKFTVVLAGDEADVQALCDRLVQSTMTAAAEEQRAKAAEYGWVSGITTCCDVAGYNPPDGSFAAPVHHAEVERDESEVPPEIKFARSLERLFSQGPLGAAAAPKAEPATKPRKRSRAATPR